MVVETTRDSLVNSWIVIISFLWDSFLFAYWLFVLVVFSSDRNDGRSWLVFYVFVGAVPGSMELLPMMQRLLKELNVTTVSNHGEAW